MARQIGTLDPHLFNMRRREFLGILPGVVFAGTGLAVATVTAQDSLYVLKPNDLERLRLDYNANKGKVRLLFVLSPT